MSDQEKPPEKMAAVSEGGAEAKEAKDSKQKRTMTKTNDIAKLPKIPKKTGKVISDGDQPVADKSDGSNDLGDIKGMLKSLMQNQKSMNEKVDIMWAAGSIDEEEDFDEHALLYGSDDEGDDVSPPKKRKLDKSVDENTPPMPAKPDSKFSLFFDKIKRGDKKGPAVDENLAELVNGLFRDGLSEEVFKDICKLYDKPENCGHLTSVKVNQLVWDILAPGPQAMDVKLQTVQTCLAKAGITLTKLAENIQGQVGPVEEIMNALSFLGHGYHNLCLRRRELLKKGLNNDYGQLCSASVPYTDLLFGDEVEKKVKDITDVRQVGSKIRGSTSYSSGYSSGGYSRARGWRWAGRGRGFPLNAREARFHVESGPYQRKKKFTKVHAPAAKKSKPAEK